MKKGTIQFLRWVFLVFAGYQAIDIAGSLARFFYHANQPDVVLGAGVGTFFALVTLKTIAGLVAFGISIWLKTLYHKMKTKPLIDSTIAVVQETSMVDNIPMTQSDDSTALDQKEEKPDLIKASSTRKVVDYQIDCYKTLGIIPNAELAIIKAAYKALVSMYHPDGNNNQSFADKLKDINLAYEVLSNPTKKSEYDSQIKIHKDNASKSTFSISTPFYREPLEKEWEIACGFYPSLKVQYSNLAKISWSLAYTFKLQLLDSKCFDKSLAISQSLKSNYLSMYFGNDKQVINYAELLIISRKIDAALYLNSVVKVMGNNVTEYDVKYKINQKYPGLNQSLNNYRDYKFLIDHHINDEGYYFAAKRLVMSDGGIVKDRIFSPKIDVQINGKEYEFTNIDKFTQFVLKTFSSKYD